MIKTIMIDNNTVKKYWQDYMDSTHKLYCYGGYKCFGFMNGSTRVELEGNKITFKG